ncbi:MAG: hypothetical protein ACM3Q4_15850 [Acidobacteriota bacterium]
MRSDRLLLSVLLLVCALNGCGLFDTREPESPVGAGGVNPPASSPEMVLQNFTSAVQQKNIQDYEKLFSDSVNGIRNFTFVPSPEAAVRYASVFSRWSRTSETDYFRNAVSSLAQSGYPNVTFMNPTYVRFQSDSAIISTEYLLLVPHRLTTVTTTFTGRADFYTARDKNQTWTIYRWVDYTTKRDSSWSDCKGAFAQ